MVSSQLFEQFPSFPTNIPTAAISKISFEKLMARDDSEASRTFEACVSQGYFLLNLENEPTGEKLIRTTNAMFGVAKEIFDLSLEEKLGFRTVAPHKLLGYKGFGFSKTDKGEPDRCEFFNIGQDDLLSGNQTPGVNPQIVNDNHTTLISYLNEADPIIRLILNILGDKLGLPTGKLSSFHRCEDSGSAIRMLHYPPQLDDRRVSMVQHTDFGIITIVSNILGGLEVPEQVSPGEPAKWRYIKPEPNSVLINLGDAIVELTGGILRSSLHRVTFAPGQQAMCDRYSIAYLSRPAKIAPMKRLTGGYIPSVEGGEEDLNVTASEWERNWVIAMRDGKGVMESRGGKGISTMVTV